MSFVICSLAVTQIRNTLLSAPCLHARSYALASRCTPGSPDVIYVTRESAGDTLKAAPGSCQHPCPPRRLCMPNKVLLLGMAACLLHADANLWLRTHTHTHTHTPMAVQECLQHLQGRVVPRVGTGHMGGCPAIPFYVMELLVQPTGALSSPPPPPIPPPHLCLKASSLCLLTTSIPALFDVGAPVSPHLPAHTPATPSAQSSLILSHLPPIFCLNVCMRTRPSSATLCNRTHLKLQEAMRMPRHMPVQLLNGASVCRPWTEVDQLDQLDKGPVCLKGCSNRLLSSSFHFVQLYCHVQDPSKLV